MRGTALALILVLGVVSAISGTVAALATSGRSACQIDPSLDDGDTDAKATFQRVLMVVKRSLPVR